MVATVCVVLVLLGLAAFAASVPDNDGAEAELRGPDLDVTWIQNNGEYTFMGIVFKVIKDADTEIRSDSLPGPDIIIDSSSVAEGCFSGSSIRTVLLTDRVSSIGKYAFKDCTELESFTKYAQTPLSVNADSFVGCNSLKLLDIRGNVSMEGTYLDSGKSLNLLVDPGVTDSEIPHNSLIRLGSLDGKLNGAFYKDGRILISYTGKGLLEMRSDGGVRTEYNRTIMLHDEIYSFEPFSGEDSTIAHRTFHVDFVPKDIVDCDMSVTDSVVDLLDLTYGDPEATSWKGWYEVNMEMSIGKSIDRDLIENLDIESLRLRPDSSGFSVTYKFTETPAGEKLSTITSVGCDWSKKYSAATDTKYYRCIGWVVEDDPNGIVHPVGSDIRIYKNHVVYSVWAPLDEYVYSVQYLNVDGSVLVDSDYGHGMKVSIKDVVPADETIDKMLDGWLVNGKGGVFRTGDTFTITGDVTLVPCMKDRPGHNFIVDGEVYATQFAGDNFPMTISCVDPLDVKRIFTGWCADEFGPFFNGESAVLDGIESLNATWRDKKSFTLTYMSEGTEVGSSLSLLEKDIVTVEADVSKAHHVLTGWSCEGHIYSTGDTFEILEDTVLTAVWEEMEKNTLTYHPYGADPVSIELYPDETATISSEHGIREHHIFLGWSTAEDGPVEYLPDDSAFFDSDTNLYTVWRESRVFTATYISDGNTIGEPEEIYESTAYTVSAETSKPHHSLKGWMCGDRLYRNGDSIEVTGDIILTAAWAQLPKYTLSYRMPSGTDATSKHYPDETVVISECIEAIDGSVFIGWSVSENADPSFLPGDRTVLASDMELYPCWRAAKEFVVSFISDGETISEPVIVKEGGQLTVHADASKPHHVLKGWSDGARTFEDGSIITPDEDIVFSAIWEEMPKYTLSYRMPSGTDATSKHYPDETVVISECIEAIDGSVFIGWSVSENADPSFLPGDRTVLASDMELYPCWRAAKEFVVSFISDGETISEPVIVKEGGQLTVHADASKPHHVLKGWSDGARTFEDGSIITPDEDIVFSAIWEEMPKYTLTYHPYGDDAFSNELYPDEKTTVSSEHGFRDGHLFLGWTTCENENPEYIIGQDLLLNDNLDLYTVWRVAAEFTVSYISDEKPLGDPVTVNEGSSIIIHFEAIKPHHFLKGWTDGTTLYQDGSSIVIANDLVLTAVWEEMPKYTITYHPFDSDPVEESFYIDETAEVDCKPGIKTDFTFIGWSTTEDGEAEYHNGDTIATAADLSLYPVWKHDETAPVNPPKDDPSNDKDPDVGTDDEGSGNKPSGDNDSEKDPSKPSDDDDFDYDPSIPSDEDSGDGPSPPSDD